MNQKIELYEAIDFIFYKLCQFLHLNILINIITN